MKTYDEIVAILQDKLTRVNQFAWEDFDSEELGLGTCKHIGEADSGGEDEGSDWQRVFHFVDHDVYIKVTGYYQSYNGTEFYNGWGCLSEVRPTQRTITVYE